MRLQWARVSNFLAVERVCRDVLRCESIRTREWSRVKVRAVAQTKPLHNSPLNLVYENPRQPQEVNRSSGTFWGASHQEAHSLHRTVRFTDHMTPGMAEFCVTRYSTVGDVILDPFCGYAASLLQAQLMGRRVIGTERNRFNALLASSRLGPVSLDEIVLSVAQLPLGRPIVMNRFNERLARLFHPDTFRELVNLFSYLNGQNSRAARFMELLAISRLLGTTKGHLNGTRRLEPGEEPPSVESEFSPEYRAVAPRLIKAAATVLRDSIPSEFQSCANTSDYGKNQIQIGDARSLGWIARGSVDSIITRVPLPFGLSELRDRPLERWFTQIRETPSVQPEFQSLSEWRAYIRQSLRELLRVVKPDGSLVFDLSVCSADQNVASNCLDQSELDEVFIAEAEQVFTSQSRLRLEEVLVHSPRGSSPTSLLVFRHHLRRGFAKRPLAPLS